MTETPKEAAGRAKVPLHLIPPVASEQMALALWSGAHHPDGSERYGEWNWRDAGINLMTYVGALKRHIDGIVAGEWIDPKSGHPHMAHIMAGAAISLDAEAHGMMNDDRPIIPGGPHERLDT